MCMSNPLNFAKSPLPALRWMSKVNPILKMGQDKHDRDEGERAARERTLKIRRQ